MEWTQDNESITERNRAVLNDQALPRQQGLHPVVATLLINGLGPFLVYSQLAVE
jgi:hypothetical protein